MASMEPRQNTSDHTFGDVFSTIPSASQQNNGMNSVPVQSADNSLSHPDDKVMNRIMQMYSSPSNNSTSSSSSAFLPHEQQQNTIQQNYQQQNHQIQQQNTQQVQSPQVYQQQQHHQMVHPNEQIVQSVSAPSTPVLSSVSSTQQVTVPQHTSHSVASTTVQGSAPSLPSHSADQYNNSSLQKEIAGMIEQSNMHRNQQHQQILQHFNTQATQPISSLTNQNREMMTQMQMYFERITRFMEGVDRRLNNLENVTSEILKAQSRENGNVPIEKSFADKREFDAVRRAAEQYEKDAELAKKLQQQFEVDSRTPQPPPVQQQQQRPLSVSTPMMQTARPTPPPSSAIKSPHSNEMMETCPICSTQVVVSLLQDHVNECLDGGLGANAAKNSADPAQQGSLWKRIFGKKDEELNNTPTPKPADPLPLPPISPPQTSNSLYPGNASHSPPVVRPPPSLYGQPNYPGYPSFNGYPQQPATPAYPQNQGYYYYAVPPGK
eukprot:TRINITY_DN820_c0_g1_i1.p1 TRINITY_DN820_c0_g1~~TRINITY_DN820_c0_g1_i1.p1  ORF type:complete len:492 (+),score=218.41 TRINITY_DN820_c0_g1_i1:176-1651(+)